MSLKKRELKKLRGGMKSEMTKRLLLTTILALAVSAVLVSASPAQAQAKTNVAPAVPLLTRTLGNARYVYVTSYDGDQFNINLLPDDRQAIAVVQDAIQKWGKLTLVYEPGNADIVLMVMSRPSEDVLAAYDAHGWPGDQYRWRVMRRSGLQKNEAPLMADFQKAFELAATK
jgi:hypothetical protein